jgi:hypothetical protein
MLNPFTFLPVRYIAGHTVMAQNLRVFPPAAPLALILARLLALGAAA